MYSSFIVMANHAAAISVLLTLLVVGSVAAAVAVAFIWSARSGVSEWLGWDGAAVRRANEAKRPEIVRRRRAVAELVGLGWTADEIARFLRVSAATVLKDIYEMRRGG